MTLFPEAHVCRWGTCSLETGAHVLRVRPVCRFCPLRIMQRLLAENSVGKCPGVIDVEIGPLIETKGRDPHTVTAEVEAWIEGRVNAMPQHAGH